MVFSGWTTIDNHCRVIRRHLSDPTRIGIDRNMTPGWTWQSRSLYQRNAVIRGEAGSCWFFFPSGSFQAVLEHYRELKRLIDYLTGDLGFLYMNMNLLDHSLKRSRVLWVTRVRSVGMSPISSEGSFWERIQFTSNLREVYVWRLRCTIRLNQCSMGSMWWQRLHILVTGMTAVTRQIHWKVKGSTDLGDLILILICAVLFKVDLRLSWVDVQWARWILIRPSPITTSCMRTAVFLNQITWARFWIHLTGRKTSLASAASVNPPKRCLINTIGKHLVF